MKIKKFLAGLVATAVALSAVYLLSPVANSLAKQPTDNKPGAQKIDWNLSGAVMPVPPYGSGDIPGSDTASKLIVNQPNGKNQAAITGVMNGLTPNTDYTVYLSNGYTPYVATANISAITGFGFEWNDINYPNDVVLAQSGSDISGTIGWPSGPSSYLVTGTVTGTVIGNTVTLTVDYSDRSYSRTMTGVVAANGSISGDWIDANNPVNDHGTWTSTGGIAVESGWNVTGNWDIAINYLGTDYIHTTSITQSGTSLSGTMVYPGDAKTITSGSVAGNAITIVANYTEGGTGTVTLTGVIANDGSMSGTWLDTWGGLNRTGTWSTTGGSANVIYSGSGSTGHPGMFNTQQPFTFTTDESGSGSWHINLKKGDLLPETNTLSVWINGSGATVLISDNFTVVN